MPSGRANIKYELAKNDDQDVNNHYVHHVQDFQAPLRKIPLGHTMSKTLFVILVYFFLSISLTFYQQWLYKEYKFHFPLTVVLCHLIFKFSVSACIRNLRKCCRVHSQTCLSWPMIIFTLGPPGIASGLDVGISNWALSLITMSLYTMTKSTTVIFILGFALLFNLEKRSWSLVGIVVMISTGLMMFTYKSTQFDFLGFMLCLLASFSSAIRWTLAQIIMQKSPLGLKNPIDMMYYMQPWMILSLLPLSFYFEGMRMYENLISIDMNHIAPVLNTSLAVLGGAGLAFSMEVMEYLVVTYGSSLTLSISGIFKEICILVLAYEWKREQVSGLNFVGLLLCLGGIILHVIKKVILSQQNEANDTESDSNSMSISYSKSDEYNSENDVPLMNKQRSNSMTNLLSSGNASSDEEEIFKNDNSNQVLNYVVQRREQ